MNNKLATIYTVCAALLVPLAAFAGDSQPDRAQLQAMARKSLHEQIDKNGRHERPDNRPTASVPEPGVLIMLGTGLMGLAISRRRKQRDLMNI